MTAAATPAQMAARAQNAPLQGAEVPERRAAVPVDPMFPPVYRVGAVFALTGQAHHYCTGSVVDSPHRNLVITAAHCVHGGAGGGYRSGLGFAPGLQAGRSPAGLWRVRSAVVSADWALSSDPASDVAFLVIEPLAGRNVQDVVGGNPVAVGRGEGPVRIVGYPSASDNSVTCDGTAELRESTQLRVYCPGFTSGTSGGPWIADADQAGGGQVVGVIGGYEYGGNSPDVSYSSYFDTQVADLYRRAVAQS